jgi:hypothetical protein
VVLDCAASAGPFFCRCFGGDLDYDFVDWENESAAKEPTAVFQHEAAQSK